MSKRRNANASKDLERRYGYLANNLAGYHHHLDFRCYEDFTDDAFFYLMQKVKGVNMLDVNETDISNESITFLTHLEYVNELRAKECHNLNDECTEDLNKLTQLVFLHLKSTNVTIDGLLKLNNLSNLKTLMFSADDVLSIKEKLLQLKTMLPQCELVINSKPYYTNATAVFINFLKHLPLKYRLKVRNESLPFEWSSCLSQNSDDTIETENQGSFPFDAIEWVEIKLIENSEKDELIKSSVAESQEKILKMLEILNFPHIIEDDGVFSVYLLNEEM